MGFQGENNIKMMNKTLQSGHPLETNSKRSNERSKVCNYPHQMCNVKPLGTFQCECMVLQGDKG
jgi:hypothetical protein